ncbi:DUF202 domain-containing protein [Candidatus Bathyarchaeota archaeon]|nr:DUF202 domain-containing protein [Candidatus Bathyarchaeota archaeon]
MVEESEQEILNKIRTLLALERNYLAEERTALAEFRTGLALTVIAPPASTVIAYTFSILKIEQFLLLEVLNLAFFGFLTILGAWTSLQQHQRLKRIKRKKRILRDREAVLIRSSEEVYNLMRDFIDLEEN